MARRALLTGVNGFIGSHILTRLLDHGFTQSQVAITIVPDIVAPEAYHAAIQGTPPPFDTVYNTASPFTYRNVGSNLQFLEPAIKGTLNLLKAVKDNAPNVKRVIWTGSCASVIDYDNLVSDPPRLYTEADWNRLHGKGSARGSVDSLQS
ncbi:hypothetical protein EYZ11_002200 [Aspergillus tanneri]|uniref:NAD-dependent epimerase/dehydratase domain-containing protein n=1 Tax=Aspergillus tanneri TaxID=1220188 RepID=A0A4S3JRE6_9EURO|nr:hypothetical protein EYZ11_002200 [Aspergillus tanneri]